MNTGILYMIATPIGNLEDITLRALRILKEADVIFAEDTRVAKKLLSRYGISTPTERYDDHSAEKMHSRIVKMLSAGKICTVVSDAGTPGISDPGARVVAYIRDHVPGAVIIPVPGASAISAALSVCGISGNTYTFLGYPPHKKGRKTFFKRLPFIGVRPVVLYESPHRFLKTLSQAKEVCGAGQQIFIGREITKLHEEFFSGDLQEAEDYFIKTGIRGEFVLIFP